MLLAHKWDARVQLVEVAYNNGLKEQTGKEI